MAKSIDFLKQSSSRGYLDFAETEFGWPESKTLYAIHHDPELSEVRRKQWKEFVEIFPEPTVGGGGCFPGNTFVMLPKEKPTRIKEVSPGDRVRSLDYTDDSPGNCVCALNILFAEETIEINDVLEVTAEQLLMGVHGWRRADCFSVGDILAHVSGLKVVRSLRHMRRNSQVFSLELKENPVYFANGYLAHNKIDGLIRIQGFYSLPGAENLKNCVKRYGPIHWVSYIGIIQLLHNV